MNNKSYILLVFMFVSLLSNSQNLIPNGDFETYSSLPNNEGQTYLATGWNNVNGNYSSNNHATPDYFHTSGFMNVWFGAISPHSGSGQMGLITSLPPSHFSEYREYISIQLNSTLIVGQEYQLKFQLTNGTNQGASNNFGVHFSELPLYQDTFELVPVIPQVVIPGIINNFNFWQQYTFTFTANNPSDYVTFGNFKNEINTSTNGLMGYYFIDDIILIPKPNLQINGDISICQGDSTALTETNGTPVSWAEASNPSNIISTSSSFTVAPIVTTTYLAFTATDTASHTVTVYDYPLFDLGNDTVLCQGQNLLLDVTTPNATYLWQDNSTNSTLNITQTGIYWVEASLNACTATDTIQINVNPAPNIDLGTDTVLCQGETLLLDITTPNATYLWQNNSINPTFNVFQQGTYWVEVTENNCSSKDTINVYYNPIPIIDLGTDTILCQGENLILDASAPNATYLWQDNSINSTFDVDQQGTYSVEVTVNNCSSKDSIEISYNPLPNIHLGNDTTLCEGETLILDVTTPNASYIWQDNSTNSNFNVTQSGTYSVKVTANDCETADTIIVNYNALPIIDLGNDTIVCEGEDLQLNATIPNATYLWQDNSNKPILVVSQQGIYWVEVIIDNCSAEDTIVVNYKPLPNFDLGPDLKICQNDTIILDATTPNATYLWQDNSIDSVFYVTQEGEYWVEVNLDGCFLSDYISVIHDCESILEIPNIFTPNGDGVNDYFIPVKSVGIASMKTVIVNRWGNVVFETDDPLINWDGQNVNDGTYFWIIEYVEFNGAENKIHGFVKIVK